VRQKNSDSCPSGTQITPPPLLAHTRTRRRDLFELVEIIVAWGLLIAVVVHLFVGLLWSAVYGKAAS
jgi:hypothetical protein